MNRLIGRAARFPDFSLAPLRTEDLAPRDAALARAIDHAVARHWISLETVLDYMLDQPWTNIQPRLKAALLAAAAQLLVLDRIPDHAAIHQAVEWTKRNASRKAGGLVNAVLRRVATARVELVTWRVGAARPGELPRNLFPRGDGTGWMLQEPVFADDLLQRVAQQTSHPESLISHWVSEFGFKTMLRLAHHNMVAAHIIIAGLPPGTTDSTVDPHRETGFYVLKGSDADLKSLLERHPGARVQDPATAEAVTVARSLPEPDVIVDYCAGKGTKTRQLAAVWPRARIIATDRDESRWQTLHESFRNCEQVEVMAFDDVTNLREAADLLVLDVPCTNSGVLGRRPEARYRFGRASLEALVSKQRQIIADAIPLLRSNAHMLYTTCSTERAENELQVDWMCRWHPFAAVEKRTRLPQGLPGDPLSQYSDGGFAALLKWGERA